MLIAFLIIYFVLYRAFVIIKAISGGQNEIKC